MPTSHALADARSLALHRVIADRVRRDPTIIERARKRVQGWRLAGSVHAHYCDAWLALLAEDATEVARFLEEDTERARELRQATPFAGILDARERWRVWRTVKRDDGVWRVET